MGAVEVNHVKEDRTCGQFPVLYASLGPGGSLGQGNAFHRVVLHTGGEGSFTQWVHCEFVVSFEAICPVITQQVCGEFF